MSWVSNSRFHSWQNVPLSSHWLHFTIKMMYLFNFINMNVFLHIWVCSMYIEGAFRDHKRVVELDLQMVLGFCGNVGNRTQVWKSSTCTEPLSYLAHLLKNCVLEYQQPMELVGKPFHSSISEIIWFVECDLFIHLIFDRIQKQYLYYSHTQKCFTTLCYR